MQQLINNITASLQKWYYYKELKEITLLAIGILSILFLCKNGINIIQWLLTQKGMVYFTFFLSAMVLGLVIKLYYHIMVIKYHEKDTNIRLFENIDGNN